MPFRAMSVARVLIAIVVCGIAAPAVIAQTLLKKVGGGRVAAHEIMIGTPAIRNLIREDKVAQMYSAIQTGQAFGMQTLDQNLSDLLKQGLVTRVDAQSKAQNKDAFA